MRCANGLLLVGFTVLLCVPLFAPGIPLLPRQLVYLPPLIHVLAFSREPKLPAVFWLAILAIIMNLIGAFTHPVFELLPSLFPFHTPSLRLERFLCVLITNLALFLVLELIVRFKKACPLSHSPAHIVFLLTIGLIYMIVNSLSRLQDSLGNPAAPAFLPLYIELFIGVLLNIHLLRAVCVDSERANRYLAELSLLRLSKQHLLELEQLYKAFTRLCHDHKHHLQVLQELVDVNAYSSARPYLRALTRETPQEKLFFTGSPCVDALLTAKNKLMSKAGITFCYSAHPLASLPISTLDFCSLVGNLLDNAIEGVLRIAQEQRDPEKAVIHLTLSRAQGRAEYTVKEQTFYVQVSLPFLDEQAFDPLRG